MISVSDSSTALIVPYGTTNADGLIHAVRSIGAGSGSRDASTTMSAPRTQLSQSSVARTFLPQVLRQPRGECVARLSGRRE